LDGKAYAIHYGNPDGTFGPSALSSSNLDAYFRRLMP
jgi:hypothetical protein